MDSLVAAGTPGREPITLGDRGICIEAGVQVDWNGFEGNGSRLKVTLPTYAFQRERYWLDDRATSTPLAQRSASLAEMAVRFESLAELQGRCSIEAPDALAAARRFVAGATPDGSSGTIERIWRGEAEALGEIHVNAGVSPLRSAGVVVRGLRRGGSRRAAGWLER